VTTDQKRANGYRDLLVWQKGILLVKRTYELTARFPTDEKFGLVSQMRRAAVSIPSNIAEGQARHSTGEFIQSISHAEGSVAELDTQLTVAMELGYSTAQACKDVHVLVEELRKMLNSLRRKLVTRH